MARALGWSGEVLAPLKIVFLMKSAVEFRQTYLPFLLPPLGICGPPVK
jgi:hypothetical protein